MHTCLHVLYSVVVLSNVEQLGKDIELLWWFELQLFQDDFESARVCLNDRWGNIGAFHICLVESLSVYHENHDDERHNADYHVNDDANNKEPFVDHVVWLRVIVVLWVIFLQVVTGANLALIADSKSTNHDEFDDSEEDEEDEEADGARVVNLSLLVDHALSVPVICEPNIEIE